MIIIDSREKPGKNKHIIAEFDRQGISHDRCKCYIGDYQPVPNPGNVYVERKADLQEFSGNCGTNHARFKNELLRLDRCGGKLFIVIEEPLSALNEVKNWTARRQKFIKLKDGTRKNVTMQGEKMLNIMQEWKKKHNIEYVFIDKANSGALIIELLKGGVNAKSNIERIDLRQ